MSEPVVINYFNLSKPPTAIEQKELRRQIIVYFEWISDENNKFPGDDRGDSIAWDENTPFIWWWELTVHSASINYEKLPYDEQMKQLRSFYDSCSVFNNDEIDEIIKYNKILGRAATEEARIYELDFDFDANPIADLEMLFDSPEWMAMHHAAKKALKVFKNDTNT